MANGDIRIGFYLGTNIYGNLDMSSPDKGNPGVGGTQYSLLLIAYFLTKMRPAWSLSIFTPDAKAKFPDGVEVVVSNSFEEVLQKSEKMGNDFLVMKTETQAKDLELIRNHTQKIIFCSHNFIFSDVCKFICENDNILANVFVGKQQYDRYIDHDVIDKSEYIFNMSLSQHSNIEAVKEPYSVVYMGSIVPDKGFLELAKLWKKILKSVPKAKLKVIGTGKLYSRDAKLGEHGIADASYEKKFWPHISDSGGKLLDSVEFLGLLGEEKLDVFRKCIVGVVNPSARTETFNFSAVEMQSVGLPIVTLNKNSFPDVILNSKTGCLANTQSGIAKKIIYLLNNPNIARAMGSAAKKPVERFSPDIIMPKWISFFENLKETPNMRFKYHGASAPYLNNQKCLRMALRFIRKTMRISFFPSLIEMESFAVQLIKRLIGRR